jgi:hypothetical protein
VIRVDVQVYRAPLRSRRDDVDPYAAVERALTSGLCGVGEPTEERAQGRLRRFLAVPDGSFVWTRDVDGLTFLGRLGGRPRVDDSPGATAVDLVHVRDCVWLPDAVEAHVLPAAVSRTFDRGGRNFQQIHDPDVAPLTTALWERAR